MVDFWFGWDCCPFVLAFTGFRGAHFLCAKRGEIVVNCVVDVDTKMVAGVDDVLGLCDVATITSGWTSTQSNLPSVVISL